MADEKISELTDLSTSGVSVDYVSVVDKSATTTKRIGLWNLINSIQESGTSNMHIGRNSGNGASETGKYNLSWGYKTATVITSGSFNLFRGHLSGSKTTSGSSNVFSGCFSGKENTTGYNNVFDGAGSGFSNTVGFANVFSGKDSGYTNTTGYNNVFDGAFSGYSNTTGRWNFFGGHTSGYNNTSGTSNVFNGQGSGSDNTIGSGNIFSGMGAGGNNVSGCTNIIIGYDIDNLTTSTNQYLNIGDAIKGNLSNAFIGIGSAVTLPTAPLDLDGNSLRIRTAKTPASAVGAAGDKAGMIAWDNSYIYNCTQTYTAASTGSKRWKRVATATW